MLDPDEKKLILDPNDSQNNHHEITLNYHTEFRDIKLDTGIRLNGTCRKLFKQLTDYYTIEMANICFNIIYTNS